MSDQKTEQKHTPQAFPCLERGGNGLEMTDPGMSLRDYFAGQVICGLMARAGTPDPRYESRLAYEVADAMLAARPLPAPPAQRGEG